MNVDRDTLTISAEGKSITFAPRQKQSFHLLARLARNPGSWIWFDTLRAKDDVWDGVDVADGTIKSAISRLRKLLMNENFPKTADRLNVMTDGNRMRAQLRL